MTLLKSTVFEGEATFGGIDREGAGVTRDSGELAGDE